MVRTAPRLPGVLGTAPAPRPCILLPRRPGYPVLATRLVQWESSNRAGVSPAADLADRLTQEPWYHPDTATKVHTLVQDRPNISSTLPDPSILPAFCLYPPTLSCHLFLFVAKLLQEQETRSSAPSRRVYLFTAISSPRVLLAPRSSLDTHLDLNPFY